MLQEERPTAPGPSAERLPGDHDPRGHPRLRAPQHHRGRGRPQVSLSRTPSVHSRRDTDNAAFKRKRVDIRIEQAAVIGVQGGGRGPCDGPDQGVTPNTGSRYQEVY